MEFPAFIVTLRDYVREGLRADVHETDEQFLDTAAYWRNEYEKSREAEQQLRAQIRVLEQRLKSISSTLGEKTQSTGTSQRKRKRDDSTSKTRSGRRQTKLVKTTKATAAPQSNDVQPIQIDDGLPFGENDTQLIDCFLRIPENQQAISKTANNNTTQIDQANIAIQSAADARRVLLSIQTHTTQSAGPHKARTTTTRNQEQKAAQIHAEVVSNAETKCNVVIQLFPFLLRSLDTLHEPSDTSDFRNQVIYCIINLFQSLLEHICNLSACEGLQKLATAARGGGTGKANGRLLTETTGFLPAPSAAPKSVTAGVEDKVIKMLCQLAVAMMNDLDASTPARQEVFDGFIFFLLLRVGDLLKVFTFGVEPQNSAKGVHPEDMLAFHEAQAPYLIFLLRHASSLASQKSKIHRNSQKTGNAGSDPQEDAGRFEDISLIARKRLQHTLLKGVFGEQADEYVESLRRPIYSSTECEVDFEEQRKRRKDCDMSKWFQNEVWETVGWNVLEEMVAWT